MAKILDDAEYGFRIEQFALLPVAPFRQNDQYLDDIFPKVTHAPVTDTHATQPIQKPSATIASLMNQRPREKPGRLNQQKC